MRNDSQSSQVDYKPSGYMRARRPHLFSDSVKTAERAVTREVLDHHLDTITSRKEEAVFETFARRLVERFVAPNLVPQTGPTGGGDGKTDAETYPVVASIAFRWHVPNAAPAHERWAFAFSAKKKWREKARSDVAEIVGTGRGYPKIFFVTNQFASAQQRAKLQDEFLKKHGVPVTIFDRAWLLDHVFDRDSLDIAIEVLGVGANAQHLVDVIGPKDRERLAELEQLEKAILDGTKYIGAPHALIEDCLPRDNQGETERQSG